MLQHYVKNAKSNLPLRHSVSYFAETSRFELMSTASEMATLILEPGILCND